VDYLNEVVEGLLRDNQVHAASVVDISGRLVTRRQRQDEAITQDGPLLHFEVKVYLQQETSDAFSLLDNNKAADQAVIDPRPLLGRATVSLTTRMATAEQRAVLLWGVTLALFALVLAVYVGIRIANNFTRRIETISQAIQRIRHGDALPPITLLLHDKNELAVLAEDVNVLAQELSLAKMQARTHVEALEQARENAEALVETRTRELAMAHNEALKVNLDNQRLITEMNRLLERERQHTSREIHDQLNALLVTIRLGLERLQKNIQKITPAEPRLQETQIHITEILERVSQVYTVARGIIHRLRPEVRWKK
jgi:nitrogen fixation/metabolism regulation signal transduction histidine kinase